MGKFILGMIAGIFIGGIITFVMMALLTIGKTEDLKNSGRVQPLNSDLNAERHSDSDNKNGVC